MASTREIERLFIRLSGDATLYIAELRRAEAATNRFALDTQKAMRETAAAIATVGVTLGVVAAASTKAFSKFDLAMTEATSIMDIGPGQSLTEIRESLEKVALTASTTGKQGPIELAKAYYEMASAGFSAEQSIKALPAVMNFATAGAFDMTKATDLAVGSLNAIGMSSENAEQNLKNLTRVTDVLVKANTFAQATTEQFGQAMTTDAAATARQYGISLESLVSLLAVYAKQNYKGRLAGGMAARAIRLLANSTVEHGKAQEKWGIRIFDKLTGKMRSFADIAEDVGKVSGGLTEEGRAHFLKDIGFEALTQKAILPIIGTEKLLRQFDDSLKEVGGTTQEVADKQMKAFANQMQMVKNQVTVAAITVGRELAPAFGAVGVTVGKAASILTQLMPVIVRGVGQAAEAVAKFYEENRRVINIIFAVVGAVIALKIAYKAAVIVLALFSATLNFFHIQQLAVLAVTLAWKLAVLTLTVAWQLFNLQILIWTAAMFPATTGAWLFNAALGVMNILLSANNLLAAAGTVLVLAAAFAAAYVAVYALYNTLRTLVSVVFSIEEFARPLGHVSELFKEWHGILKDIFFALEIQSPKAWEIMRTAGELAISQIADLWPPLWKMIDAGFRILWSAGADLFEQNYKKAMINVEREFIRSLKDAGFLLPSVWEQWDDRLAQSIDTADLKIIGLTKNMRKKLEESAKGFSVLDSDKTKDLREKLKNLRGEVREVLPFPEVEGDEAFKKGEKEGKDFNKGLDKELRKFDAAAYGTSEAVRRLQEYRDRMTGRNERQAGAMKEKQAIEFNNPQGNAAQQAQNGLLKNMNKNIGDLAKKNPIFVQGANL